MKRQNKRNFIITLCFSAAFVLWTAAVRHFQVQAIGPRHTTVGFAALNGTFHQLTGVHWMLYTVTDWLGLVPLFFILGFAALGLVQLIRRRSLLKVDHNILVLGGFYLIVMAAYLLFERFVINYRPVLIEGYLEASYPSSTTMLVMCVMPTAILQLSGRIKNRKLCKIISVVLAAFTAFMVIGRLISGVHWFTDIIGGILLSIALVMLYYSVERLMKTFFRPLP